MGPEAKADVESTPIQVQDLSPIAIATNQDLPLDEVDVLCIRMFANKVEFNPTEGSVTRTLDDVRGTIGVFVPPHLLAKVPKTWQQLEKRFDDQCHALMRLPTCRYECMVALDTEITCNICMHSLFNSRSRVPVREFCMVSIADVIRCRLNIKHPHIISHGCFA
jgi:hypothetical protein